MRSGNILSLPRNCYKSGEILSDIMATIFGQRAVVESIGFCLWSESCCDYNYYLFITLRTLTLTYSLAGLGSRIEVDGRLDEERRVLEEV